MLVWLIFATREMAASAGALDTSPKLEQRARAVLAAQGYPANALANLRLRYISAAEIEAGGGRFHFFR
jgi:hypothetical protein